MNEIPDTLVIYYLNLAPDSARRLYLLSAIGTLLGRECGLYTPIALELSPDAWLCLRVWIEQGHGNQFWRLEHQGVFIARPCERHILVGTAQLMADLKGIPWKPPSTQRPEFGEIWALARRYITAEIVGEAN